MDSQSNQPPIRRVLTLVQICQRAAAAQVDSIDSLGPMSYALAKPIIMRCTAEQLLHLEQSSPHLSADTSDIWKDWCFQKYRLLASELYSADDDSQEPVSWRDRYFELQNLEAKRFEEIGSKLRTQRMQADVRKKQREVKFTDKVPVEKRSRTGSGWNTTAAPKTLFEKARAETLKIQRAYAVPRMIPKKHRVTPQSFGAPMPSSSSSSYPSRVAVKTVVHSVPIQPRSTGASSSSHALNAASTHRPSSALIPPALKASQTSALSSQQKISSVPPTPLKPPRIPPSTESPRPKIHTKKDPMATLFVPKHRAYSQRPA
ncbi:RNA polymerase II transcription factor SIII subunit A-domain-containing protein [Panaeolus papilionaceus]|nr:RNA polymerase II transcription factor SIII subunit A-domain-containing protein [Panaeolus papilionaceus]